MFKTKGRTASFVARLWVGVSLGISFLLPVGCAEVHPLAPSPLFADSPVVGSASRQGPEVIRERFVTIALNLLGGGDSPPSDVLVLNLFEDVTLTARLSHFERAQDGYTWIGRVEGVKLSDVVLVVTQGVLAGSITMPGATYVIEHTDAEYQGKKVYTIYEIDQSTFPPD